MSTKQQYRWRPAPWRVGQKGNGSVPAAPPYGVPEEGSKKTGTVLLVLVGASVAAFGILELLGVTKVFAPAPAAVPPGTVPGALPATTGTPPLVPAK